MCRFSLKIFLLGVSIGILLAILLKYYEHQQAPQENHTPFAVSYKKQTKSRPFRKRIPLDTLRYDSNTYYVESERLKDHIDIVCIILVRSVKNEKAARQTWARGCTRLETIDLSRKKRIPKIGSKNKAPTSWSKLCYVLQSLRGPNWVFIVNDSAFVILENLRLLLSGLDPHDKYYLGHPVHFWSTTYNSAQGGIVLSKGSLNALRKVQCYSDYIYNNREDYFLGKVLDSLGIPPGDTTDLDGFSIFTPSHLHNALVDHKTVGSKEQKCCSNYLTTFHAIDGDKMYTYYYLLHTLQLFYTGNKGNKPMKSPPDIKIWGAFLQSRNISLNITSDQYYKIWTQIVDNPSEFAKRLRDEAAYNDDVE